MSFYIQQLCVVSNYLVSMSWFASGLPTPGELLKYSMVRVSAIFYSPFFMIGYGFQRYLIISGFMDMIFGKSDLRVYFIQLFWIYVYAV